MLATLRWAAAPPVCTSPKQNLGIWGRSQLLLIPDAISYRAYAETSQLGGDEENQLEEDLHSNEQRLFWHEDSKPGTLV